MSEHKPLWLAGVASRTVLKHLVTASYALRKAQASAARTCADRLGVATRHEAETLRYRVDTLSGRLARLERTVSSSR